MNRFAHRTTDGSRLSARERFRTRRSKPSTRLQLFALAVIIVAGAAYYFGTRQLPLDAFVGTLQAGDEQGRIAVRVEPEVNAMSMPFTTATGDRVRLYLVGPPPARLYWGQDDFEAREELDYGSPLAFEIERALAFRSEQANWPTEAEAFLQALRTQMP